MQKGVANLQAIQSPIEDIGRHIACLPLSPNCYCAVFYYAQDLLEQPLRIK